MKSIQLLFVMCVMVSTAYASPPISGDFNGDGQLGIDDIDPLMTEIAAGTNNPQFDLTGDGLVDLADRDGWLAIAGDFNLPCMASYLLGDVDLDGTVILSDLNVLEMNIGQQTSKWSDGDFNGDGIVDAADRNILGPNLGLSSCDIITGACCLPDGQCITDTEGNCTATGGTYQGDGTDCETAGCLPIPTLSQWGIIALSTLLLIFGVVAVRQRNVKFG